VELYTTFTLEHYSMVICAVAVFPIILCDMLKLTHRVAGPLVRFRNELARLARGENVEPVRLRDGDLLDEFLDAFNEFVKNTQSATAAAPLEETGPARDEDAAPTDIAFDFAQEEQILRELEVLQSSVSHLKATGGARSQQPGRDRGNRVSRPRPDEANSSDNEQETP
jgi:hypothetical protein